MRSQTGVDHESCKVDITPTKRCSCDERWIWEMMILFEDINNSQLIKDITVKLGNIRSIVSWGEEVRARARESVCTRVHNGYSNIRFLKTMLYSKNSILDYNNKNSWFSSTNFRRIDAQNLVMRVWSKTKMRFVWIMFVTLVHTSIQLVS